MMIQVLERAFKILDFIAENPEEPKGLGALAKYGGLNQGTCANIVKSLCQHNFLEQVGRKKGYILGPAVYYLARNGPYRRDIVAAAEPLLSRLASEVQETVLVATLHQGKRSILLQVNGNRVMNISNDFLLQESTYDTATGRLLLAFLSASELENFLARKGLPGREAWPEAASRKKLDACLCEIRKKGVVMHSSRPDIMGISYPLKSEGEVIAALGLFLPSFRFKGKHKELVLKKMGKTADEISKTIIGRMQ
ncbi:MAG: helix-turn-helix domain-containing protein [Candidatus Omnitrophica bacterium]|nr:helix-turn-helix domain-containing protein [Candidatus Omnitrophota bacterium]